MILIISIISIISIAAYYYFQGVGAPSDFRSPEYSNFFQTFAITTLIILITYFANWFLIAKDIKEKRISWANMALPIFLSGIGGLIYFIINHGKSSRSQNVAVPQQASKPADQ